MVVNEGKAEAIGPNKLKDPQFWILIVQVGKLKQTQC